MGLKKIGKKIGKVLKKAAPIAGAAAGMYLGGPAGASLGASLGGSLSGKKSGGGGILGSLFGGGDGGGGGGGDFASGLGGMAGSLYNFYGQEKVDKGILEAQLKAAEEARNQLNPYAQAGTEATQRLSNRLAQGFNLSNADELTRQQYNSGLAANPQLTDRALKGFQFNQADLYNDPGYKFQFGEGERALNAQAARSGLLGSGRALKEATQYGQGMAEGQFGNVYNRNLNTWTQENQNLSNLVTGGKDAYQGAFNRWGLENAGMQNLAGTGLAAATGIGKLALETGTNRADYRVRRGQGRTDLSSGLLDNAGPVLGGIGNYLTNLGGEPAQVQGPPMPSQGVFGNYFAKSANMPLRTATRKPLTRFGRQSSAQNMRLSKGMGGSNWKVIG